LRSLVIFNSRLLKSLSDASVNSLSLDSVVELLWGLGGETLPDFFIFKFL
jgi:hypothetical protein